jgi:hypothetical protein
LLDLSVMPCLLDASSRSFAVLADAEAVTKPIRHAASAKKLG